MRQLTSEFPRSTVSRTRCTSASRHLLWYIFYLQYINGQEILYLLRYPPVRGLLTSAHAARGRELTYLCILAPSETWPILTTPRKYDGVIHYESSPDSQYLHTSHSRPLYKYRVSQGIITAPLRVDLHSCWTRAGQPTSVISWVSRCQPMTFIAYLNAHLDSAPVTNTQG